MNSDKAVVGVVVLLIIAGVVLFAALRMARDCDTRGGHIVRNMWGQWECVREVQGPPIVR